MKALIMDGEWAPRDAASLSEESLRGRIAPAREVWRNVYRTIQDVPEPRLGPYEVIVQPKVTAICGSDFLRMETDSEGYMTHWSRCALPIIAGHELGGTVVEVGKNVEHLKVGDHVTTEVGNYCGRCRACHAGILSYCQNNRNLGSAVPGVFAEYVALRARSCWRIDALRDAYSSDEEMFEAASMTEPMATPYYDLMVRGGGFKPGEYLVFYMAGPKYWLQAELGISLAKFAGAGKVIVVDMLDEGSPVRQRVYREMGADHIIRLPEAEARGDDVAEQIMECTHGDGGDLYWENANMLDQTLALTVETMALGARFIQTAHTKTRHPLPLDEFGAKGGQIIASEGHIEPGTLGRCLRVMAAGVDVRPAITKLYEVGDLVEAFRFGFTPRDGHVAIRMPGL